MRSRSPTSPATPASTATIWRRWRASATRCCRRRSTRAASCARTPVTWGSTKRRRSRCCPPSCLDRRGWSRCRGCDARPRVALPALNGPLALVAGAVVIAVLLLLFAASRLTGGGDDESGQQPPAIATPEAAAPATTPEAATPGAAGSPAPRATVPPFDVGETPNFIGVDRETARALIAQLGLEFVLIEVGHRGHPPPGRSSARRRTQAPRSRPAAWCSCSSRRDRHRSERALTRRRRAPQPDRMRYHLLTLGCGEEHRRNPCAWSRRCAAPAMLPSRTRTTPTSCSSTPVASSTRPRRSRSPPCGSSTPAGGGGSACSWWAA